MAKLTFFEIQLIEDVFQMRNGYVLDFSNRTFEEFMEDIVSYNIYEKYPGLSKAKMVRAFIKDESDTYIGKFIVQVINYMRVKGLVTDKNIISVDKLYELGLKKLGKVKTSNQLHKSPTIGAEKNIDYEVLKRELIQIEHLMSNQEKGYAFERFLIKLFSSFFLNPRASYKTDNDQIDGSFVLDGFTVLVEAKYKSKPIPKDDLILFTNKLSTKSHFTRGMFITYSNVEDKAIAYFNDNSARFVIMTVEELFYICEYRLSLKEIVRMKFRKLDEEGVIFKHYGKLQ